MSRRSALVAALLGGIAGCTGSPHRASFLVSVSDATVAAEVAYVEVRILRGGCTGEPIYTAGFRPAADAPEPPLLSRGRWGFEAFARDEACARVAYGCVEVDLPASRAVEVVMDPVTARADCELAACDRGACSTDTPCDGGACPPGCDGGACPPACDGGVCPPACDGGACPGLCDPYPEESCPVCDPTTFSIDLADPDGAASNDVSIAADADGRVHAAYYDSRVNALAYAWHDTEGWFVDRVVDAESDGLGAHADIEIDGSGGAHLAHLDESRNALRYLYQAPGSDTWSAPRILEGIDDNAGVSLAVEGDGTTHAVAIDAATRRVVYAHAPLGAAWATELVGADADDQVREADVAVGTDGTVHILYRTDDAPYLHHATRATGGTWAVTPLDIAGLVTSRPGTSLAIGVEPSGRVHAVFNTENDRGLAYATRAASGDWTSVIVPIPDPIQARGELGMAVAPSGDVHVTYRIDRNGVAYVRRDPSGGWAAPMTIRSGPDVGQHSSVAVGPDGGVHVAFSASNGNDLWYAKLVEGEWTLAVAAVSGNVGLDAAIAVDATGIVRIAHRDQSEDALHVACRRPGGLWETETLEDLGAQPGATYAVATDASGSPRIAYVDGTGALRVAARSMTAVWSSEMVDPGPSIARVTSALGPDGSHHLAYVESSRPTYALRAPGDSGFTVETVAEHEALDMALAVDAEGTAHVAFRSRTASALVYARRTDAGWLGAQIDATRDRGRSVVLAALPDGSLHAIYADPTLDTLHHAELAPGAPLDGWLSRVPIDTEDENGEDVAVAIDARGTMHVLYTHGVPIIDSFSGSRVGTTYSLRYATRIDDGWSMPATLDPRDGAGSRLAATIDGLGRLHGLYTRSQPGLLHVWTVLR